MISPVNQNVKFSYNVLRGSSEQRISSVFELADKLYDKMLPQIKGETLKVSDFKDMIQSVMPERKPVRILGMNPKSEYLGVSDYVYGKNDEIIGQTIEIPMKRGKIKSEDIPTCFHEFVHVLDTLFNPKFVARSTKMFKNDQYDRFYDNFYDVLYHHEKCNNATEKKQVLDNVRQSLNKALSGRSRENKINFVQDMRNEMLSENNAHIAETRYARKFDSDGVKMKKEDLDDYNEGYLFKEKFDLLTQVGKELVADARKHNALSISKKQS